MIDARDVKYRPVVIDQQGQQQHERELERKKTAAKNMVDYAFNELWGVFPSSMRYVLVDDDMVKASKIQWARCFVENEVLQKSIVDAGLKVARSRDLGRFPVPGEFAKWCYEVENDDSFEWFCARKPPRNIVEHETASRVGFDCRRLNETESRRLWNKTIAQCRREVLTGKLRSIKKENRIAAPTEKSQNLAKEQQTYRLVKECLDKGYPLRGSARKAYERLKSEGLFK